MATAIGVRSDYTPADLRRFSRRCGDADQVRRVLALALIMDGGSRSDAARMAGVTLQIVLGRDGSSIPKLYEMTDAEILETVSVGWDRVSGCIGLFAAPAWHVALQREENFAEAVLAPGVVERSMFHNLAGALTGELQNEFWSSREMQKFASKRGDETGLAFNDELARELVSLGLEAHASAKLTWCLNHQGTDEVERLGDVDVLVISPDRTRVWVIEAKDLKMCRTLGETARRLSEYQGKPKSNDKPDNLMKHLTRVDYVRKHAVDLQKRFGLAKKARRRFGGRGSGGRGYPSGTTPGTRPAPRRSLRGAEHGRAYGRRRRRTPAAAGCRAGLTWCAIPGITTRARRAGRCTGVRQIGIVSPDFV